MTYAAIAAGELADVELAEADARAVREAIEARQKLASENRGLVACALRKLGLPRDDEDLWSAGLLGLTRAAQHYNPERGFKFSTYGFYCARREILNELRTRNRWRRETCSTDLSDPGNMVEAVAAAPEENDPGRDLAADLARAIEEADLTTNERTAIRARFFQGKTLEEVGEELGVSRERARQIQNRGLAMLRAAAENLAVWLE